MSLRSLADYQKALLAGVERIEAIEVLIGDAAGAILAEDVTADAPLPAVALAMCDGYAVSTADIKGASEDKPVALAVSFDVSWESREPARHVRKTAARIFSGAPVPHGADAVVPVGATDAGVAKVSIRTAVSAGANVLAAGADATKGEVVIDKGRRLGARQLGLATRLGRHRLSVHPKPRVVILPVGDELFEPGIAIRGAGVPESNANALSVMAAEAGANAYRVAAVPDDRITLRETIEDQLVRADLMITTGGLSGARDDTLPEVLSDLGEFEISALALTPGRHHGHGRVSQPGSDTQIPVIALPGRPSAAIVAFELYVRPVLRTMSGYAQRERQRFKVPATRGWTSAAGVVQCVPVLVTKARGKVAGAEPVGNPAQPSLSDLSRANGLAVVAEDVTEVKAGDTLSCIVWDD